LADGSRLAHQFFRLGRAAFDARDHGEAHPEPTDTTLCFALASCQYAPGLFDKPTAQSGYELLHDHLRDGDMALQSASTTPQADGPALPQPAFMLALGDQVYLDAMANVLESPGIADEAVARRAYEINWRLGYFRAVTAKLPLYTMLDDHEVEDNWQPGAIKPASERVRKLAWERHQPKLNPIRAGDRSYAYRFAPGRVPFFVFDTRSERELRSAGGPAGPGKPLTEAQIIPPPDMALLRGWLRRHHDWPVKFIASPSCVLPIDQIAGRPLAECLGSDSWSGYPASLFELLDFIRSERIEGVVFLCGDVHMCSVSELALDERGSRVHSIVSSGLYAPWLFANDHPQDMCRDGATLSIELPGRAIEGTLKYHVPPTNDARYALVEVKVEGRSATVEVWFESKDARANGARCLLQLP
jgi:hypothetical protein